MFIDNLMERERERGEGGGRRYSVLAKNSTVDISKFVT